MTNFRNGTLYVGMTNNLLRRSWEHKNNVVKGFTQKYGLHKLVYYEFLDTMSLAIEREKQIKSGSRKNKLAMIERINKEWKDLFETLS